MGEGICVGNPPRRINLRRVGSIRPLGRGNFGGGREAGCENTAGAIGDELVGIVID